MKFPTSQFLDTEEVQIDRVFDHLVACAKSGLTPGNLLNPHGVAIDPATNCIYIAEGDLNRTIARVSIFSELGEYLNCYTNELMEGLWGIAIHGNSVYVTDWILHTIFHLEIEPEFRLIARLGSRGSDIGKFNYPSQLSISTDGDVYIADIYNDRIQVLNSSLHPIKELTHPSMHEPYDVKLTPEEIYVLSPDDSPCVHVFNYGGQKMRALITRGVGMQVTRPFFFCLDPENSLILSDTDDHTIKIFSNNGDSLYTVGGRGNEAGMFYCPHGLTLTPSLKLVTVSYNLKYRLQIFYSL